MSRWFTPLNIHITSLLAIMFFLSEEFTWATLVVGLSVIVLRLGRLKVHRAIPQLVGAAVFGLAFLKYGRFISPEMGVNILFSVVCLKFLEAKEERDWRMMTLGLFLLWSSGALFVKTPLYFVCSLAGVFLALAALVRILGEEISVSWRQILRWILTSLPVTVALFVLLPRFNANVWTPPTTPNRGQVGFSEEARPGEVESLEPTGALAFHATITPRLSSSQLYWRGMTLGGHDGWNWYAAPADEQRVLLEPGEGGVAGKGFVQQDIIHAKLTARLFALPWGQWAQSGGDVLLGNSTATWRLGAYRQVRSYHVWSNPEGANEELSPETRQSLLIGSSLKKFPVFADLKGRPLSEVVRGIRAYFLEGKFTYSLAPGKVPSFAEFLKVRVGWCAHYASATALILRAMGHPARLVSGYLGGTYNPQGNHWVVSEDDAHVWVEAWENGVWQRIDPTGWIVPDRMQLPGGEFIQKLRDEKPLFSKNALPSWVRETQMWVEAMNYRFLVWSESFDREEQRSLADRLDLDLSTFYAAGLGCIALAMLLWWAREWWRTRPRHAHRGPVHQTWALWQRWWRGQGRELLPHWGPERWRLEAQTLPEGPRQFALEWIERWIKSVYAGEDDPQWAKRLQRSLKDQTFER